MFRTGFCATLALAVTLLTQAAQAQTIRMWTFLNPEGKTGREMVLKKLIAGFEAAHPGVKIVVEPQIFQQMSDKFFAAHQTGNAPDVAWLQPLRVIDAVKLGALANLDDLFVKNWSKADIDDIDDAFWRLGATPTAHYQITHSRSSAGLFYRADWFRDAGIDPKSLVTWDKFIAAAQKLTQRDASGAIVHWGFGQAFSIQAAQTSSVAIAVLLERQGQVVDDKGRAHWATPAGLEGLQLQLDMVRKYKITPDNAASLNNDDLYDQFNAGRIAMIRGASARIGAAIGVLGADKVGYLSTPGFTKYSPSEIYGWSVGVWSGSPNKQLAGEWVEYMSSKAADTQWATVGLVPPIRKSTTTDNAAFFTDPKNAWLGAVGNDISEHGWFPPIAGEIGWDEGVNGAMQDVLTNGTDPMAALQKTEVAFNRSNRR